MVTSPPNNDEQVGTKVRNKTEKTVRKQLASQKLENGNDKDNESNGEWTRIKTMKERKEARTEGKVEEKTLMRRKYSDGVAVKTKTLTNTEALKN